MSELVFEVFVSVMDGGRVRCCHFGAPGLAGGGRAVHA